jgi:hypothetical protein
VGFGCGDWLWDCGWHYAEIHVGEGTAMSAQLVVVWCQPCGVAGASAPNSISISDSGSGAGPSLSAGHAGWERKNKNTVNKKFETIARSEPEKAPEYGQSRSSSDRQFLVELSHPFRHRQHKGTHPVHRISTPFRDSIRL